MTKYCPTCESEYQDELVKCPEDGEELTSQPVKKDQQQVYVDIFAIANQVEASLLVGILKDQGISAKLLSENISQYPTLSDSHYIVAVSKANRSKAVKVITDARNDEVISQNGVFLKQNTENES